MQGEDFVDGEVICRERHSKCLERIGLSLRCLHRRVVLTRTKMRTSLMWRTRGNVAPPQIMPPVVRHWSVHTLAVHATWHGPTCSLHTVPNRVAGRRVQSARARRRGPGKREANGKGKGLFRRDKGRCLFPSGKVISFRPSTSPGHPRLSSHLNLPKAMSKKGKGDTAQVRE